MIIVSFYTIGTPYEEEAKKLKASLEALNLPHDIQPVKSLGNWRINLGYKPAFILKMLRKHKQSVLWIDADAVVKKVPALLSNTDCDIAFCVKSGQLLGGTLYFAYTETAQAILHAWIKADNECVERGDGDALDQKTLQWLIMRGWKEKAKVLLLPESYVSIVREGMKRDKDAVVEHFLIGKNGLKKSMGDAK